MKTLLINPPFNPNMERSKAEYDLIPLGLGSLAGVLEREGFPVEILDAVVMSWEDISKQIKVSNPDVVGITTYTHGVNQVIALLSLIKYINPNILTVLGGHHFDEESSPYFLSKVPNADVIVMGEGEEVLCDLLRAYKGKRDFKSVQSIVYRDGNGTITKNGGIATISDINLVPIMPYHLFDMDKYKSRIKGVVNRKRIKKFISKNKVENTTPQGVLFSKGCKGKCTFCGIFHKNVRLRARNVDDIRLMSKAGCYAMLFGVESGSRTVQRMAYKVCKKEEILETVRLCRRYDVEPIISLIAGLPGETYETYLETVNLVYQLGEFQAAFRCMPALVLPRTLLFQMQQEKTGINEDYWFTPLDLPIFSGGVFESDELKVMAEKINWHGSTSPIVSRSRLFKNKKYKKCLIIGNEREDRAIAIAEMLSVLYPEVKIDLLVDGKIEDSFPHILNQIVLNGVSMKGYDCVLFPAKKGTKRGIVSYFKYVFFKSCIVVNFDRRLRILRPISYLIFEILRRLKVIQFLKAFR